MTLTEIRLLAKENIKLIKDASRPMGPDIMETFIYAFLTQYVELQIKEALALPANIATMTFPEKQVAFEKATRAFKAVKARTQTAIGDAFSQAFTDISGKATDYYCSIEIMPEPINKHMC